MCAITLPNPHTRASDAGRARAASVRSIAAAPAPPIYYRWEYKDLTVPIRPARVGEQAADAARKRLAWAVAEAQLEDWTPTGEPRYTYRERRGLLPWSPPETVLESATIRLRRLAR